MGELKWLDQQHHEAHQKPDGADQPAGFPTADAKQEIDEATAAPTEGDIVTYDVISFVLFFFVGVFLSPLNMGLGLD